MSRFSRCLPQLLTSAVVVLLMFGVNKIHSDADFRRRFAAFKRVYPDYALLSKEERSNAWEHYFKAHPEFDKQWWNDPFAENEGK